MVQGASKGLEKKKQSSRHTHTAAKKTKKGARSIPPKKIDAIKAAGRQRTLSAKIAVSIEKQMVSAASSGKLTIMKHANEEPTK